MKIGFHIYGSQLAPAAGTAGAAGAHAGADVYRLVREGMGCDFLLVGGGPAEASSDMGRASQLIVPWGAASLCVGAPQTEIITRLNAWAFEPAHIARIGANLWELSSHRWALCLDSDSTLWSELSANSTPETNAARTLELIDIVWQHWQGRAEHGGPLLSSTGRMVGPRPSGDCPRLWLGAMDYGVGVASAQKPDGLIYHWDEKPNEAAPGESMVTCALFLGRNTAEARAMAGEYRALPATQCLVGDVESVYEGLKSRLSARRVDRIAIGLPALRALESALFRERLVPMLRAALA